MLSEQTGSQTDPCLSEPWAVGVVEGLSELHRMPQLGLRFTDAAQAPQSFAEQAPALSLLLHELAALGRRLQLLEQVSHRLASLFGPSLTQPRSRKPQDRLGVLVGKLTFLRRPLMQHALEKSSSVVEFALRES